jgi:quinol-cytochrome oxidoreductase complex cytochrome b subunit
VILSMVSVLPSGDAVLAILYGSPCVCDRTFTLLAAVHYALPILIVVAACVHMILIH